ncbi:MAG: bifunctional methylenetetrahydrofolate dehydrogenase/methenyltetrahydrofolate cyclohydrolase FolD [Candidatus Aphodosoma sp.]|nr:bifunctional methylenetetrahydrofolate dehydrogenase/methenyltetrahydrofolate cyclohydrolase FolD [Candidatus Aphodosoma sp.]
MEIISGKDMAAQLRQTIAADVITCVEKYGRRPKLAVVLVGEDPGSTSYVQSKGKAALEVGFEYCGIHKPETISESELLDIVAELNADETIDGILVQLPLPNYIDEDRIIDAIRPDKDVDGFHPMNVAALWQKRPGIRPCTPKGIIKLMKATGIDISGKNAVVIGRGDIVGLPLSKLLLDENATVTICHSYTKNLKEICAQADIIVPAVGKPHIVTEDMVKPGAVVIDVGINRNPETGKVCGDVDFDAVAPKTSFITKVPGGVGPMTIACLMESTFECYLNHISKK